jgi:hypothetical protein
VEPPIVSIHKSIEGLLFEAAVKNDEKIALRESDSDQTSSSADSVAHRSDNNGQQLKTGHDPVRKSEPTLKPQPNNGVDEYKEIADIIEDVPTTSTEEFGMTEIQSILAEFTNIEGVHTACLVGRDGFLLDSLARAGIDAEMIAAIASSGFGSAESMGNQLGQGDLRMTMFEFENGPVMFAPVGEDAFLVIVADQDTNLGWIRISIKKNTKKIQEVASL